MILEHSSYRAYLKSALIERQRKNPAYSMRAFAGQLGISQSTLSQVFSGKKNLSLDAAAGISDRLGLAGAEAEYFRVLVQLETAKNPDLKKSLVERARTINPGGEMRELSVELFQAIADWYHLAIKNLVGLRTQDFSPTWVARRLGISKVEAETAIERLLRLEMIEPDPARPGRYRAAGQYVMVQSKVPNEALRRFHRQMLEKAIESLKTQTPQEKLVESETFAFSRELLPKADALVDEFFKKMGALSGQAENPTEVYHLGVQLFNLTKGKP